MSATSVPSRPRRSTPSADASTAPPPEERTCPLLGITITWPREDRDPMVVTGEELAVVLAWLARECPSGVGAFADPVLTHDRLDGLTEELFAMSTVVHEPEAENRLWSLAASLRDNLNRLRAPEGARRLQTHATVSITAPEGTRRT